jgi:hypothetical protein
MNGAAPPFILFAACLGTLFGAWAAAISGLTLVRQIQEQLDERSKTQPLGGSERERKAVEYLTERYPIGIDKIVKSVTAILLLDVAFLWLQVIAPNGCFFLDLKRIVELLIVVALPVLIAACISFFLGISEVVRAFIRWPSPPSATPTAIAFSTPPPPPMPTPR